MPWGPTFSAGNEGSITTPKVLHVTTSGNDTTGDGSLAKPFLTAQKAFDVAAAGTGNYVLKFGVGVFGNGVDIAGISLGLSGAWPSRITLSGAGSSVSSVWVESPLGGSFASDGSIYINIRKYSGGGDAAIYLSHCVGTVINQGDSGASGDGPTPGGDGGPGGEIYAKNCVLEFCASQGGPGGSDDGGGAGSDGPPGNVYLLNCQVGTLQADVLSWAQTNISSLSATDSTNFDYGGNSQYAFPSY